PFQISSTISLDSLCITVAEKLGQFPGLVQLQYILESYNLRITFMLIQSDEELILFMQWIGLLIIPQCLETRNIST
ncbi:hypothetical protein PAXRUDRAFT_167625, partial [Paxillus rubicundulus Ve08.2h10]